MEVEPRARGRRAAHGIRPLCRSAPILALLLVAPSAFADFQQQGTKLVGTGGVITPLQGYAVALSADGNTAIVGAPGNGASWVFTRSGNVWSQQGPKLVGTGAVGAEQGTSVALSADGNTALVGGPYHLENVGAAWVFTRSGGVWSQQGTEVIGAGGAGHAQQGYSVALSADGNTALVGGPNDASGAGALWVYTRSGGAWSQQGNKLVATGEAGSAALGWSVALSADGNTAIAGGANDDGRMGAVWVFTRSGSVWSQQGAKLVGTGAVGDAYQGGAVALSADGNTALVGGPGDSDFTGAAWVFTRSGEVWSQQGTKLSGTGVVGTAYQGASVSLSGDGNTAIVGAAADNSGMGAAWVYTRNGGVWSQLGTKLVGTGAVGTAFQGQSVALSSDGFTAIVGGFADANSIGATWVYIDSSHLPVPIDAPMAFGLEGAVPNPASGNGLRVRFVLPSGAAARLELIDVAGRTVLARDVGRLGAGAHAVDLAESTRIQPGIYFLWLRQGPNEAVERVAVLD